MSMSTEVIGFIPPDEKWEAMKKIWEACEDQGINPPSEVMDFFDGINPNPAGVEIEIPHREYNGNMESGIEIDIGDIPEHCKTIRFYNSY